MSDKEVYLQMVESFQLSSLPKTKLSLYYRKAYTVEGPIDMKIDNQCFAVKIVFTFSYAVCAGSVEIGCHD